MSTLNDALSCIDNTVPSSDSLSGIDMICKSSPKDDGSRLSPVEDAQIGDIGAMAIQQLAASHAASPQITEDLEREMQTLERDIKRQKETSVNAKTAITFDQLKKIHQIGKILGPQKEAFYDRVCRAADIQRASLKNRLKQNKEKFEPSNGFTVRNSHATISTHPLPVGVDSTLSTDVTTAFNQAAANLLSSTSFNSFLFSTPPHDVQIDCKPSFMKAAQFGLENCGGSATPNSTFDEEPVKIPAERVNELFQLGFSYEEVSQFKNLFENFKLYSKDLYNASQLLPAFSNFISQNVDEPQKLICTIFNLLELGYTRREMERIVYKERRQRGGSLPLTEEPVNVNDDEFKPPSFKRICLDTESTES